MALRAADSVNHLRLKEKMETSTCNAVLKNGEKVEVFLFRGKAAVEINEQFYYVDSYPEFSRYELKAPVAEAPVQLVNEPNPDAIYRRELSGTISQIKNRGEVAVPVQEVNEPKFVNPVSHKVGGGSWEAIARANHIARNK
jgi:hypothetical protein